MKIKVAALLALCVLGASGCKSAVSESEFPIPATEVQADDSSGTKAQAKNALILGTFTTEFKDATQSRAHNIGMASKAINDKTVMPNTEFSFNEAVGPTTQKRGFMLGRIFVNGKDAKGYGGGVCQVSSTLFNAAEAAGLEITERHTHSKGVSYVPEGKDATTSYGVIDFKFKNNQTYPIRIKSAVSGEKLTVTLERAV